MRAMYYCGLLVALTCVPSAAALQLPRRTTHNTPSTRTIALFSNYLDQISGADAAAAEADRLSSQAAALVCARGYGHGGRRTFGSGLGVWLL